MGPSQGRVSSDDDDDGGEEEEREEGAEEEEGGGCGLPCALRDHLCKELCEE